MGPKIPVTFTDLFKYYKGLPHQTAALQMLGEQIPASLLHRDNEWFKVWSQDGKQVNLAAALKLIQEFEGCHLEAYPDPGTSGDPWTIGYGTTRYSDGRRVQKGDKITSIQADRLLRVEVDRIAGQLRSTVPHWGEMSNDQQCALVSFAYNLGSGFYGASGFETISKRLREKDWAKVPEALLLYRNPGTNVEAGLKRRREAEGKLWGGNQPAKQQQALKLTPASPFSALLTPHIRLGEFALDQEARRFVAQHQIDTATELAMFLERVRAQFDGKPIIITSGYRPSLVNRQVGGSSLSEHLYDCPKVGAVDFYVDGADIKAVQSWCDKHWPCSVGYGADKGFVHLGRRADGLRYRWDY